jgi:ABC-type methionine transport system ATPase subunit
VRVKEGGRGRNISIVVFSYPLTFVPSTVEQGGAMATIRLKLTFPQELIKEPVIFTMAKKFDVTPNIRRAKVAESVGEVVLELEGGEKQLEEGLAYLRGRGVKVETADGSDV